MHSALQREKLTAANRTVLSSQLAFHAMQRRRFLENSALASLPLLSSLALLPGLSLIHISEIFILMTVPAQMHLPDASAEYDSPIPAFRFILAFRS